MIRRAGPLALAATVMLMSAPAPAGALPAPRTTLPAVEHEVMCATCKIPLTVAESPQANRERVFIRRLIADGRTKAQIKRALVFQYGRAVLALPSTHGFALFAYLVPIVVVLALLLTLALLVPRWRRLGRARPALGTPSALKPDDVARLEEDMGRFD